VIEKQEWMRTPFLADELDGKTIGIIGFGRLGKIVSRYAEAFGMNVLVNDRLKIETDSPYQQVDIKTLVSTSDFIVLLISYDNENIKFFDKEKFGWMKSTAYFINTSRGEMVDENALVSALNNKQIKGAALDVLDGDSAWESQYNGNQALLEYARNNDHLIVTPHMGGYGKESIARTRQFVTEKFIRKYSHQQ
jgi:D-3-phosphoglycerate dehydrogenase